MIFSGFFTQEILAFPVGIVNVSQTIWDWESRTNLRCGKFEPQMLYGVFYYSLCCPFDFHFQWESLQFVISWLFHELYSVYDSIAVVKIDIVLSLLSGVHWHPTLLCLIQLTSLQQILEVQIHIRASQNHLLSIIIDKYGQDQEWAFLLGNA